MIEELTECKHENACLNGGIQTQLDKLESRLDAGEAMNQQQNSGIYNISLNNFKENDTTISRKFFKTKNNVLTILRIQTTALKESRFYKFTIFTTSRNS